MSGNEAMPDDGESSDIEVLEVIERSPSSTPNSRSKRGNSTKIESPASNCGGMGMVARHLELQIETLKKRISETARCAASERDFTQDFVGGQFKKASDAAQSIQSLHGKAFFDNIFHVSTLVDECCDKMLQLSRTVTEETGHSCVSKVEGDLEENVSSSQLENAKNPVYLAQIRAELLVKIEKDVRLLRSEGDGVLLRVDMVINEANEAAETAMKLNGRRFMKEHAHWNSAIAKCHNQLIQINLKCYDLLSDCLECDDLNNEASNDTDSHQDLEGPQNTRDSTSASCSRSFESAASVDDHQEDLFPSGSIERVNVKQETPDANDSPETIETPECSQNATASTSYSQSSETAETVPGANLSALSEAIIPGYSLEFGDFKSEATDNESPGIPESSRNAVSALCFLSSENTDHADNLSENIIPSDSHGNDYFENFVSDYPPEHTESSRNINGSTSCSQNLKNTFPRSHISENGNFPSVDSLTDTAAIDCPANDIGVMLDFKIEQSYNESEESPDRLINSSTFFDDATGNVTPSAESNEASAEQIVSTNAIKAAINSETPPVSEQTAAIKVAISAEDKQHHETNINYFAEPAQKPIAPFDEPDSNPFTTNDQTMGINDGNRMNRKRTNLNDHLRKQTATKRISLQMQPKSLTSAKSNLKRRALVSPVQSGNATMQRTVFTDSTDAIGNSLTPINAPVSDVNVKRDSRRPMTEVTVKRDCRRPMTSRPSAVPSAAAAGGARSSECSETHSIASPVIDHKRKRTRSCGPRVTKSAVTSANRKDAPTAISGITIDIEDRTSAINVPTNVTRRSGHLNKLVSASAAIKQPNVESGSNISAVESGKLSVAVAPYVATYSSAVSTLASSSQSSDQGRSHFMVSSANMMKLKETFCIPHLSTDPLKWRQKKEDNESKVQNRKPRKMTFADLSEVAQKHINEKAEGKAVIMLGALAGIMLPDRFDFSKKENADADQVLFDKYSELSKRDFGHYYVTTAAVNRYRKHYNSPAKVTDKAILLRLNKYMQVLYPKLKNRRGRNKKQP